MTSNVRAGVAAALWTLALALPPAGAGAQEASTRGLWWRAGVGAGGARVTCDVCSASRDVGPVVRAELGATARPGLRIGLAGGAWTHEAEDRPRETVWNAGLVAHLRLRPGSRIHLDGGLGWAGWRAGDFRYDAAEATVGLGYDLPVAGDWVLTNGVALAASSFGSLRRDGVVAAGGVSLSMLRFEVSVGRR